MLGLGGGMLPCERQTVANSSSPASPSFAGLLASLTTPAPKTAWNTDNLADDVATLSYEHALRTHAHYKSTDAGEWGFAEVADLAEKQLREARQAKEEQAPAAFSEPAGTLPGEAEWREEAETARGIQSTLDQKAPDRNLKRASITIRLSKVECEQLRKRAAQAGLTVSAYLRSCTFEAETLRAQVKDVLAELRAATAPAKPSAPVAVRRAAMNRRPRFEWLSRLMPGWNTAQREARA